MTANLAQEGDVCVVVSCCKRGPRLVRRSALSSWSCGCGVTPQFGAEVVLGPNGAIPADFSAQPESEAS